MKKTIIIFIALLSLNMCYAQDVNKLVIPADYATLKSYYIEMAGMYVATKADLTKSLNDNKKLVDSNNDLTAQLVISNDTIVGLNKDIEKLTLDLEASNILLAKNQYAFIRNGFNLNYGYTLPNTQSIGLGYNILIANRVFGQVVLNFPLRLDASIGFYYN